MNQIKGLKVCSFCEKLVSIETMHSCYRQRNLRKKCKCSCHEAISFTTCMGICCYKKKEGINNEK